MSRATPGLRSTPVSVMHVTYCGVARSIMPSVQDSFHTSCGLTWLFHCEMQCFRLLGNAHQQFPSPSVRYVCCATEERRVTLKGRSYPRRNAA